MLGKVQGLYIYHNLCVSFTYRDGLMVLSIYKKNSKNDGEDYGVIF
jgi:hypothetical protein